MQHVLVTGAGGFIGSHLVERLVGEGVKVRALVRYNSRNSFGNLEWLPANCRDGLEVVAGDVQDPAFVHAAAQDVDTVFHLAALIGIPYSYAAAHQYVSVNVQGTLNLLQAARDLEIERFVHTSTSETYGTARYVPIDELHPLQAQSPYAASKIAADKLVESFCLSFDLPAVTVRPFNTFGPRQSARAIIPTIASQALAGDQRPIRLGSLEPVRDLTYVTDTVSGFIAAAQSSAAVGQVVNLGSGEGISIGQLARKILSLCDMSAEIVCDAQRVRPEGSEVMQLVCDNTRARELLQWTPQVTLDNGLTHVIDFIADHGDLYKPDIYNV